jgi:uncharacterized phiE125 gp8 family phage protein
MSRKLITGPAVEPILLAETKIHGRISTATDDALVGTMIAAAREEVENELGRALITQTWEKYLDAFPSAIELFYPPVQSIVSVKYNDSTGALQTLDPSQYMLDDKQEPAWIVPAVGVSWPATRDQVNAVTVRFICGYGDDSTKVPNAIRNWMLLRVGALYENRQMVTMEAGRVNVAALPAQFIDRLLDRYRIAVLA